MTAIGGALGIVLSEFGVAALLAMSDGTLPRIDEIRADGWVLAFAVLVHAITAFGVGGILGGLAMTWWQRRGVVWEDAEVAPDDTTQDEAEEAAPAEEPAQAPAPAQPQTVAAQEPSAAPPAAEPVPPPAPPPPVAPAPPPDPNPHPLLTKLRERLHGQAPDQQPPAQGPPPNAGPPPP